jgi:hypothetical protein
MKSDQWKTYRTRFLVKAKQLSSSLTFTDHLGRQHCGRKGDYLVESCDGVLCITPRQIFEDIYVPMGLAPDSEASQPGNNDFTAPKDFCFEPLPIERITAGPQNRNSRGTTSDRFVRARKSPQPVRATTTRLAPDVRRKETQSFQSYSYISRQPLFTSSQT